MSGDGFYGQRSTHSWIPPSHDIEDDCQIRYMDESGPFLPSFLLSSDDVSSPLDNSSLAAYESEQTTLNLTCSDSSENDSYDIPLLRRSDSKGYEADEDGDMFQRNATTSNSEVDGTTVNSAHEDAVLVDNDQGVDEVVNTDNNEKINENDDESINNTNDLIKMVANENTDEENSDYSNKKLCLLKQKFDEIMDENNIVEEQKYVFLNDCRVELNKVVAHDKNNETMQVCLEEYFIRELEKVSAAINKKNECLADENQVCLADSFDSQKEQEVVHCGKFEADSTENPIDNDDPTIDCSDNPANEAFIAENTVTVEERDNNFNDYLNYMLGGIMFYFIIMLVSLIIYQIMNMTVDANRYQDIDSVDAMGDGNEMQNLN